MGHIRIGYFLSWIRNISYDSRHGHGREIILRGHGERSYSVATIGCTININQSANDKQRSLDELKVALTVQFEEEKINLSTLHSQELERSQEKIKLTLQEKQKEKSLKAVREKSLISNVHLQESQLEYLS